MVSLGSGTQKVVGGQFEELFSRQVYLTSNLQLPYRQRGELSLEDVDYLRESMIGVVDVIPFFRTWRDINHGDREYVTGVAGVTEKALEVTNLKLEYGRMITEEDIRSRELVAVVGQRTLEQLIGSTDYSSFIGKEVKIENHKFLIIGVLGVSASTVSLSNDVVLIPFTTFHDIWRWEGQNPEFFLITYDSMTSEQDIIKQAEYLLNSKYGTVRGKSRFLMSGVESEINLINNIINS